MLPHFAAIAITAAALTWPGARVADDIERPAHRFAVQRPAPSWIVQDSKGEAPGSLQLSMGDPSADAQVIVSVLAMRLSAEIDTAEAMREAAEVRVAGKPEYSDVRRLQVRVGDQELPGLQLNLTRGGAVLSVVAAFLTAADFGYAIQVGAPPDRLHTHDGTFQRFRDSFRIITPSAEEVEQERLRALASRCGSELAWARSFSDARSRANKEQKLVLAYARFYPGFEMSDPAMSAVFTDRDLVGLVRACFVPVRLQKTDEPLASHDVYGLSTTSFGTAVIITTPEGDVLGETYAVTTTQVTRLLLQCLEDSGKAIGTARLLASLEGVVEDVDERGFLALVINAMRNQTKRSDAPSLLDWIGAAHVTDPGGLHQVGSDAFFAPLRLAIGDAKSALHDLRVARSTPFELPDHELYVGIANMRLGELTGAAATMESYVAGGGSRSDEARYWLGECRLRTHGEQAAREAWAPLLEDEGSPFAWRAAAALTSTTSKVGIHGRLAFPPDDVARAAEPSPFDPRDPSRLEEVVRDAVRYLLEQQREEGSWICGGEIGSVAPTTDQDLTVAISAICARSLLPQHDVLSIRTAIDRALGFLARARQRAGERSEPVVFMEYGTYADAYTIRFLADAADLGLIEAGAAKAWIEELASRLSDKQRGNGGWSYYLSGDIDGTGVQDHSIGFVTGAVTLAVLRARDFGASLESGMVERAVACLREMKNRNGTFEYMTFTGGATAPRGTGRPGAAGRGPVMTLALLRGGEADLDELTEALDIYVEHQPHLAREAGKALMHCGHDGQGSHYVMFNYATCAQAIAALPASVRGPYRDAVLRSMLTKRTEDGAFLDNPLIGRAYGAAMALVAIDALRD